MHMCYFDEKKHSEDNPDFYIGGLMIPDEKARDFEVVLSQIVFNFFGTTALAKESEMHGKDLFHGKGAAKKRALHERIQVFKDVSRFIDDNKIPVRMVRIDVEDHRKRYRYPMPEYRLGLMLILERFDEYLEQVDDLGLAFGDFESDEVTRAVVDFSEYRTRGTPMHFGRELCYLLDTVYFTQSHHSRFLQVADLLVYMAGRYETNDAVPDKWHETEVQEAWKKVKASENFYIQHWP